MKTFVGLFLLLAVFTMEMKAEDIEYYYSISASRNNVIDTENYGRNYLSLDYGLVEMGGKMQTGLYLENVGAFEPLGLSASFNRNLRVINNISVTYGIKAEFLLPIVISNKKIWIFKQGVINDIFRDEMDLIFNDVGLTFGGRFFEIIGVEYYLGLPTVFDRISGIFQDMGLDNYVWDEWSEGRSRQKSLSLSVYF